MISAIKTPALVHHIKTNSQLIYFIKQLTTINQAIISYHFLSFEPWLLSDNVQNFKQANLWRK